MSDINSVVCKDADISFIVGGAEEMIKKLSFYAFPLISAPSYIPKKLKMLWKKRDNNTQAICCLALATKYIYIKTQKIFLHSEYKNKIFPWSNGSLLTKINNQKKKLSF